MNPTNFSHSFIFFLLFVLPQSIQPALQLFGGYISPSGMAGKGNVMENWPFLAGKFKIVYSSMASRIWLAFQSLTLLDVFCFSSISI